MKETVGIGTVKKGESASMKIMALMNSRPDGDGWEWNRHEARWERTVPMKKKYFHYQHSDTILMCACKKHSLGWCVAIKCPTNNTEGGEANE